MVMAMENAAMYVIAGVTGNTGSVVASELLAAKHKVRVIVRDAAKGEAWRARGAEVAVADLDDAAALTKALTGATGAYLLLPPPGWSDPELVADRKRKIEALTTAVKAAKPGHVVMLSSIGAELASGNGPIRYLHTLEAGLRTTGVPVTFLRAGAFMENWGSMLPGAVASGALYYAMPEGLAFPQVATEDIGKTAARLLLEGGKAERVVELSGPAETSLADVAAAAAKASGKPVKVVSVPEAAMVESLRGMGASEPMAHDYGEMATAVGNGTIKFHGTPVRGKVTLEQRVRSLLGG
jgi:uncharacterized protein YbjT (DUF2867 family)